MISRLPNEITQLINAAWEDMHSHPTHMLSPFHRRVIYKSIDKVLTQTAHKTKVTLCLLTAQHVIHFWNIPPFMVEEHEEDYDYWLRIPQHLIEVTKNILNANVDRDSILEEVSHLSEVNNLTGQTHDSPYYHEWCVFKSALSCVWEALNLDSGSLVQNDIDITHATTDEELGWRTDTAMFASLAYAGGSWIPLDPDKWFYNTEQNRWLTNNRDWYFEDYGVWDRNTDAAIARRQEFWEWWLFEAVAEAWKQAR